MEDTLFFSVRTQVLLPRDFLIELYELLQLKNCSQVMLFEPYGLSRETNDLPASQKEISSSYYFRDTMFLHNYQGLGMYNGFTLTDHEFIKTQHLDLDYRIEYLHLTNACRKSNLAI